MTEDGVWYHEDDHCQIELLPKAAEDFARHQAGDIDTFSAAHDDGGMGWTDIYLRGESPASLKDLNITLAELAHVVPSNFRRIDRVLTGYASYQEPAPQVVAWQADGGTMFASFDESGIISEIWFCQPVAEMEPFLSEMANKWPLILADWSWSRVVDLSDRDAVRAYLTEKT